MPGGRVFRRMLSLPTRDARAISRDVDDEVAFHLAMRVNALQDAGLAHAEAESRARQEFGDIDRARRDLKAGDAQIAAAERKARRLDELGQDVRYSVRQLRRNPGFTVIAALTPSLGIGANTAIFSAVRGILLQPLGFSEPDRLLRVFSAVKNMRSALSVPDYFDLRAGARRLTGLAAYSDGTTNLTGDGAPVRR